jgi:hypothetical protein
MPAASACVTGDRKPPIVTRQCAPVLAVIRQHQPIQSLCLTAEHAIPEAAARIHDLRGMRFNILTTIHSTVVLRGVERRKVASFSFGTPEWPRPGFLDEAK